MEVMYMPKIVEAVYENGVFKPLTEIPAREQERFKIIYYPSEEFHFLQMAEEGGSFDFLKEEAEDIYSSRDGKEV